MPDWIARANIEHFKKLLEKETDPWKRAVIERELAEEEAKLPCLRLVTNGKSIELRSFHSRQWVGRT